MMTCSQLSYDECTVGGEDEMAWERTGNPPSYAEASDRMTPTLD